MIGADGEAGLLRFAAENNHENSVHHSRSRRDVLRQLFARQRAGF